MVVKRVGVNGEGFRFPGGQQTSTGEREVKKALGGTLFMYEFHSNKELFQKVYGYIVLYY